MSAAHSHDYVGLRVCAIRPEVRLSAPYSGFQVPGRGLGPLRALTALPAGRFQGADVRRGGNTARADGCTSARR